MAALRAELRELRKWVALNYVAVVKAVKKRNRHLRGACASDAVCPVSAVALLSTQHFFTSGTLAALSTRAEVLAQVRASAQAWGRRVFTFVCFYLFCWLGNRPAFCIPNLTACL